MFLLTLNQFQFFVLIIFIVFSAHCTSGAPGKRKLPDSFITKTDQNAERFSFRSIDSEARILRTHPDVYNRPEVLPPENIIDSYNEISQETEIRKMFDEAVDHPLNDLAEPTISPFFINSIDKHFPNSQDQMQGHIFSKDPAVSSISREMEQKSSSTSEYSSQNSPESEISEILEDLFKNGLLTLHSQTIQKPQIQHDQQIVEEFVEIDIPDSIRIPTEELLEKHEKFILTLSTERQVLKETEENNILIPQRKALDATEQELMVELMPWYGVYINKNKLADLVAQYRSDSPALIRALLDELIIYKNLPTLHKSSIPLRVLDAIKEYVTQEAEPKLNHVKFNAVIYSHLSRLRKLNNQQENWQTLDFKTPRPIQNRKEKLRNEGDEIIPSSHTVTEDSMVKLVSGSEVMINEMRLNELITKYRHQSRELIRQLILELVPHEKLSNTELDIYTAIPDNVRDAVKAYIAEEAKPKLRDWDFLETLRYHLYVFQNSKGRIQNMRTFDPIIPKANENPEKKSTYESFEKLDGSELVELLPGSKIMINQVKLCNLVKKYKNRSRDLIRKISLEVIPRNILTTMVLTSSRGRTAFPENIRYAVQAFVSEFAEPKLTPREFTNVLYSQIKNLRARDRKEISSPSPST